MHGATRCLFSLVFLAACTQGLDSSQLDQVSTGISPSNSNNTSGNVDAPAPVVSGSNSNTAANANVAVPPPGTTVGDKTPGVATGGNPNKVTSPSGGSTNPNKPATNPNATAGSPNKTTANPNTSSSNGSDVPAAGNSNDLNGNTNSPVSSPDKGSSPNAGQSANVPVPDASEPNKVSGTDPQQPVQRYTAVPWPNIGFHDYNGKLGKKVVALTFDDGPDGSSTGNNNTDAILDYLATVGIKASFFVCGNVWTDLETDSAAQRSLQRMVDEGHDVGSHTYTHPHLDTISASTIIDQLNKNLTAARGVLGSNFQFTVYRAPFGFPYQSNNPNVPWVANAAASSGVHVGWGIDTDDWKCAGDGKDSNCILTNLKSQLDAGRSGPILMHSVYRLTAKTLPDVVQMLKQYGYTFATVEDMIKDKYGATSAEIVRTNQMADFSYSQIADHAVSECRKNNVIRVVY